MRKRYISSYHYCYNHSSDEFRSKDISFISRSPLIVLLKARCDFGLKALHKTRGIEIISEENDRIAHQKHHVYGSHI